MVSPQPMTVKIEILDIGLWKVEIKLTSLPFMKARKKKVKNGTDFGIKDSWLNLPLSVKFHLFVIKLKLKMVVAINLSKLCYSRSEVGKIKKNLFLLLLWVKNGQNIIRITHQTIYGKNVLWSIKTFRLLFLKLLMILILIGNL